MKRIKFKYILFGIIAFVLAIGFQVQPVMAASGSISAGGGGTVNVDNTISITFSFSADETLYGLQFGVSYDPNVLQFVSGNDANGGGGNVLVASSPSAASGSKTLTFKALQPGTSNISVTEAIGVGADSFQMTASGTSVTVAAPANLSADNSLKSLQISPGTLSPAFSQQTTRYNATVPNTTSKLTVSASPSHSAAKVTSVSGADSLSVGNNTVSVVVQAEDGSTATYTITVNREGGTTTPTPSVTPTPSPTPEPEIEPVKVNINGQPLLINSELEESDIPEAFKIETRDYDGREVNVAVSLDGELTLFYLTDSNGLNGNFYIYNETTDTFNEYIEVEGKGGRYIILPIDDDVTIPDNFIETNLTIEGKEIIAWQIEGLENDEYYIVYAKDGKGEKGLFTYDTLGHTFQRFSPEMLNSLLDGQLAGGDIDTIKTDLDNANQELSSLQSKYDNDMATRLKIMIGLGVLSVILFIILVNSFIRNRMLKEDLSTYDEYDEGFGDYDSSDNLVGNDEDVKDWTEEYASTHETLYVEDNIDTNKPEKTQRSPETKETQSSSEDKESQKLSETKKTFEEKDSLSDSGKTVEKKNKENDYVSDLENASLEDIFEFLNVDDIDDEDVD